MSTPDFADEEARRAARLRAVEDEVRKQMLRERAARLGVDVARPAEGGEDPAPKLPGAATGPPRRRKPGWLEGLKERGGLLGGIASLLLVGLKFAGPIFSLLFKSKILLTFGSALLSIVLEATAFGWPMAVGIVLVILIHECGHAFATWQKGLPVKGIYIIPFMGGIALRGAGGNAVEDAYIGIMGPVFGGAAGLVCLGLYPLTGERFFLALSYLVFYMHLFNMAPIYPLDGSKVLPLFSPRLLVFGLIGLLVLAPKNPMIWVLALMSLPYILSHWKVKPGSDPQYRVSAADRWKYGALYAGLTAFFALSSHYIYTSAFAERERSPRSQQSVPIRVDSPKSDTSGAPPAVPGFDPPAVK